MTIRRPPQRTESTAVIQRPQFSDDGFASVPSRDSDDGPDERTDPERRLVKRPPSVHALDDDIIGDGDLDDSINDQLDDSANERLRGGHDDDDDDDLDALRPESAGTGRYDLGSFDDFEDDRLPSAHVSEFEASDLDGDVEGGGAPTTIMQLPPSMLLQREPPPPPSVFDVPLRKWSAGPPGAKVAAPPPDVVAETMDEDSEIAATLPALSLAAVRAAALAAGVDAWPQHADAPLPLPPALVSTQPTTQPLAPQPATTTPQRRLAVTSTDVISAPRLSLRLALEEALTAVTAAQTTADSGHVPPGLHAHLERAVDLLSRAIDIADED